MALEIVFEVGFGVGIVSSFDFGLLGLVNTVIFELVPLDFDTLLLLSLSSTSYNSFLCGSRPSYLKLISNFLFIKFIFV